MSFIIENGALGKFKARFSGRGVVVPDFVTSIEKCAFLLIFLKQVASISEKSATWAIFEKNQASGADFRTHAARIASQMRRY